VRISHGQGRAIIRALVAPVVLGSLMACGPVKSSISLVDANAQVEAARTAGAEKQAPYEWTAATLYLHQAREEVGRSEYEHAIDFANKASKYAGQARALAEKSVKAQPTPDPARP
jgi:hypothetical protein